MLEYPHFDPVAIALGPLQVHWYGLMYLFGFMGALWMANYRTRLAHIHWTKEQNSDLLFYSAIGVIVGGRAGYVFFYNFSKFLEDPLWLFQVWEGGMSFHGGFLGVLLAMFMYARKHQRKFWELVDYIAPYVPIGLATGRFGNFIGGELWGKPTDFWMGMVFPGDTLQLVRHPSQLYECFFEGIVLFIVLIWFSTKPRPTMAVSGVFAMGYGLARFCVEFVREPDAHIGYLAWGWFTQGQLLTVPMLVVGLVIFIWAYKKPSFPSELPVVKAAKKKAK